MTGVDCRRLRGDVIAFGHDGADDEQDISSMCVSCRPLPCRRHAEQLGHRGAPSATQSPLPTTMPLCSLWLSALYFRAAAADGSAAGRRRLAAAGEARPLVAHFSMRTVFDARLIKLPWRLSFSRDDIYGDIDRPKTANNRFSR